MFNPAEVEIAGRRIGTGHPCFIVAEAGVNHDGRLENALALVDVAAEAGADAVKFQTFSADRLATREAPKAAYQGLPGDPEETQHAMLARLELSEEEHRALVRRCIDREIVFLSTPFDEAAADLLERLGVAAFKTPSGELTNLAYLAHLARKRKPLIVSTGMATLGEVEDAVSALQEAGGCEFALLHCVSAYPASPEAVNLRAMSTLRRAFGVPIGYSDHTLGLEIALASVALGASIVEKHFTLSRSLRGPDHRASLEPAELRELVRGVRAVEASLGDGRKVPAAAEAATASVARKSLVASRMVEAGTRITNADIVLKRPGTGLRPALRSAVVGRSARVAISEGSLFAWEMFD